MDMDLEPYCAAPAVTAHHRFGLTLSRNVIHECVKNGVHTLWEEDVRGRR
jgi:hypothetical protein